MPKVKLIYGCLMSDEEVSDTIKAVGDAYILRQMLDRMDGLIHHFLRDEKIEILIGVEIVQHYVGERLKVVDPNEQYMLRANESALKVRWYDETHAELRGVRSAYPGWDKIKIMGLEAALFRTLLHPWTWYTYLSEED